MEKEFLNAICEEINNKNIPHLKFGLKVVVGIYYLKDWNNNEEIYYNPTKNVLEVWTFNRRDPFYVYLNEPNDIINTIIEILRPQISI